MAYPMHGAFLSYNKLKGFSFSNNNNVVHLQAHFFRVIFCRLISSIFTLKRSTQYFVCPIIIVMIEICCDITEIAPFYNGK